jgi:signal transduction histidine kinase
VNTRCILVPVLVLSGLAAQAQEDRNRAQSLVKEAVAFAKKNGKDVLLKETNQAQGRFHVKSGDELFIFIYDVKGVCLASGFQPQVVGMNRFNLKDSDGKFFFQEMITLCGTKGSGWVDYKYPNPKTGKVEAKTSWVENLDGWVVGCGVYK